MAFNRMAATAASVATICILTGTLALAQAIRTPDTRYVAASASATTTGERTG